MPKSSDIRIRETQLHFLPTTLRVPLKFGAQVVERSLYARVRVVVEDRNGRTAEGWGETPLSVAWVWPSPLSWEEREQRMADFCKVIAAELPKLDLAGHPMELGDAFQRTRLDALLAEANRQSAIRNPQSEMPHLAALVCHSLFDLAVFDAFGNLLQRPVFETLGEEFLTADLAHFLDGDARFAGLRPPHFLRPKQTRDRKSVV